LNVPKTSSHPSATLSGDPEGKRRKPRALRFAPVRLHRAMPNQPPPRVKIQRAKVIVDNEGKKFLTAHIVYAARYQTRAIRNRSRC